MFVKIAGLFFVEFARVQVRMRERMEEAAREAPAEARAYGTKARMQHVLDRLDIRAESLIEFVSDIHMQNAFMTSLENLERFAWEEYTGYPPEVLRPVNGEAHSDWETIHAKVQRWAYEGYKRLASLPKAQPGAGDRASEKERRHGNDEGCKSTAGKRCV